MIPASRASIAAGVRFMEESLLVGGRFTAVGPVEDPPPSSPYLPTERHNVVDLFASAHMNEKFTMALNIDNLLDRYYVQYLNISPNPGRNAKFTATLRF